MTKEYPLKQLESLLDQLLKSAPGYVPPELEDAEEFLSELIKKVKES